MSLMLLKAVITEKQAGGEKYLPVDRDAELQGKHRLYFEACESGSCSAGSDSVTPWVYVYYTECAP